MIRPRAARLRRVGVAPPAGDPGRSRSAPAATAQQPPARDRGDTRPVLHHHRADHLRDRRTTSAPPPGSSSTPPPAPSKGKRPILVFEFLPGDVAPGTSEFGACYDLANLISKDLAGAELTVAYVPQPLRGYAVLPVLACTEIVMGSSSSLGPITPEGHPFDAAYRELVRFLAMRKTRDPDLLLGMLDRDADLRLVRTADNTVHYVLAENLDAFQKTHQVIEERPAWDGGLRGVLTAAAGPRGGLLQADRRLPRRAGRASTRSPASRPSTTRPSAS